MAIVILIVLVVVVVLAVGVGVGVGVTVLCSIKVFFITVTNSEAPCGPSGESCGRCQLQLQERGSQTIKP